VFFKPTPTIEYVDGRKAHVFECAASQCRCKSKLVRRFLDTRDAKSTSNLRRHAKACWGEDTVAAADDTSDLKTAREALSKRKDLNGTITAAFERAGKGRVTYSHRQHTKAESRYVLTFPAINEMPKVLNYSAEFVRWVAESKRPFQIVNDRGFRSLMKTGRPECYIPSAETVSRDVKKVFVRVRDRIATMLQVSPRYSIMDHLAYQPSGIRREA
jgi:hypothetical protein